MNNRIVLFIDSLGSGGAQRQILMLAKQLVRADFDVSLLVYHDIDDLAYMLEPEIKLELIPKNAQALPKFLYRVFQYFRREKPRAIIAYLYGPSLMSRTLGRLAGVSTVITSQRNLDLDKSSIQYILERLTYRLATKIVTNAYATKDQLCDLLPKASEKLEVIHNAVDTGLFSPLSREERSKLRRDRDLADSEFVFLLPGRIEVQKNHLGLIQAALEVADRREFVILFAGNEFDLRIKDRVKTAISGTRLADRVIFLGQQKDMRSVYALADCVILPSLWEGLPNVLIEAMACECPVIASDVADNKIVVPKDCGIVFDLDGPAELTDAMSRLLDMDSSARVEMGLACRKHVEANFSETAFLEKHLKLIGASTPSGSRE
ncbi:MAG: glycosyltransferase family 4 protein [Pseudomonadota bacterium]